MVEILAIVVPAISMVVVACIGAGMFGKAKKTEDKLGPVPPETNLYTLLSQQGGEIAELREEVRGCKEAVEECEKREKILLDRLGIS